MKLNIRSKVLLALVFTLVILMSVLICLNKIQNNRLKTLFVQTKNEKANSFDKLFDLKSKNLQNIIYYEYGEWNDLVDFVYDFNNDFAESYIDWLISGYDFNSVWVFDSLGNQIYSISDSTLIDFPYGQGLFEVMKYDRRKIRFYDNINSNLVEIIGSTLFRTQGIEPVEPPQGYIISSRILKKEYFEELEKLIDGKIYTNSNLELTASDDIKNPTIIFMRELKDWKNQTITNFQVVIKSEVLNEAISSFNSVFVIFFSFSLLLIVVFWSVFYKVINIPLNSISKSLNNSDPTTILPFSQKKDEFGVISRLITDFFDQKDQLEVEIKNRLSAENNLQKLNTELESLVKARTIELQALIHQAPMAIGIFDKSGQLIESNQVYDSLFKIHAGISYTIKDLFEIVLFSNSEYLDKLRELMSKGGDFYTTPLHIESIDKDSNTFKGQWLIFRFFSITPTDKENLRIVNLIEDVTHYKKSEEAEKRLSNNELVSLAVYNAQEEERKRVARELHDSIGQKLSSVQMQLESYSTDKVKNENKIQKIKETIFSTGKEIRQIIKALHPTDLDDYGLIRSLELLCSEISSLSNLKIFFNHYDYPEGVDSQTELNIFRIIQEALNNIVKHSNAIEASVQIYYRDFSILINIEDTGTGLDFEFDNFLTSQKSGYGLLNMKRRAESLKGNFYIESSELLGTEIHVQIPWRKNG